MNLWLLIFLELDGGHKVRSMKNVLYHFSCILFPGQLHLSSKQNFAFLDLHILIFIALLQIKLFSLFQIRKLFGLIFFKIYWDDSLGTIHPNFQKSGRTSFLLEILK